MIATRSHPRPEITPAQHFYRTVMVKQKPAPHQSPFGRDTIGHAMPVNPTRAHLEREERRRHAAGECCEGCALCAVDAMHAARPLRPPPGRPEVVPASAAAIALAADRRAGLVGEWGF
jgi:hypothetical protein